MNVRGVLVILIIRLQGLTSRYTHTEWLRKQTLGEEETAAYLRALSRSFSLGGQRDSDALFLEILLTELPSVSQWLPVQQWKETTTIGYFKGVFLCVFFSWLSAFS